MHTAIRIVQHNPQRLCKGEYSISCLSRQHCRFYRILGRSNNCACCTRSHVHSTFWLGSKLRPYHQGFCGGLSLTAID